MDLELTTLAQAPEFEDKIAALNRRSWPTFLRHGDDAHWGALFEQFSAYQLLFVSGADLAGVGHTVPLVWDQRNESLPEGIETSLLAALDCRARNAAPNTLAALAVMVADPCRGKQLSLRLLQAMKRLAAKNGMGALIVPVRPTLKSLYPTIPFERYVAWQRADGSPFDPWLRTHWKLNATVLKPAPRAMTVTGSVAEWERWTGRRFPTSGAYVVDGALQPVVADCDQDVGRYEDPNLWMLHTV